LNGNANGVNHSDHAIEKLRSKAAIFGTVVEFELDKLGRKAFLWVKRMPPLGEGVDKEVAGFVGGAKSDMQLSSLLINNATRRVFLVTGHIMITGTVIATSRATAGEIADVDSGFHVHTHSFDSRPFMLLLLLGNVIENGIRLFNFLDGFGFDYSA